MGIIHVALFALLFIGVGASIVFSYMTYKKQGVNDKKSRDDFKEFEKAMRQADRYSDKRGWLSIEWLDRDQYVETGMKKK